jgi:hypothetical protein
MENTKPAPVYVLRRERINGEGHIVSQNVGVTFNIHEAEAHKGESFENDFDTIEISANWREDAETTAVVEAIRTFRTLVEEMQEQQ